MESKPIPKYHIAPNFSIPPVEAGGVLELGSIIPQLTNADEEPINNDCHVRIPQNKLFCGHQRGFTANKSRMMSGEYGLWAKAVGIDGIGGELSWAPERSVEDVYHFRSIDTIYFNPTREYIEESMSQADVQDYVTGSDDKSVFMVTGIKTAKGPSVKMSKSRKWAVTAEMGFSGPAGLPIELGPKMNTSKEASQEMGFEASTDFIIGIRVKELMYEKHWLTRKRGALVSREHNKGASMVDDDVVEGPNKVVDLGDETEGQIEVEMEEAGNKAVETQWIIKSTRPNDLGLIPPNMRSSNEDSSVSTRSD